ncbi:MAG: hypothetical protein CVU99_11675 [Firmicutes bacterium HGW-Firmicutes-4]|jgi:proline iminopeptidase|nr:MAG: hypothetical protein CVU99_11675 [Firmicutes bacterium HGW-Firmicutes-4]
MQEGFINFQGKKIWYSVYGKESKKTPLLVIHGGPGFHTMTDVFRDLSDERPIYFYDQLGGGNSERADDKNDYTLAYFIAELDAMIQALKLEEVILLGHSWGGALVASYLLEKRPEHVKALILASPYLGTPMMEESVRDNFKQLPDWVEKTIHEGDEKKVFDEKYQQAMFTFYKKFYTNADPVPEYIKRLLTEINPDVYETLWGPNDFTINGTLRDLDLVPQLHQIGVPVLITVGDCDATGVKPLKDCQLALPHAYLAVIPNATHFHFLEKPDLFKLIIRDFLRDI